MMSNPEIIYNLKITQNIAGIGWKTSHSKPVFFCTKLTFCATRNFIIWPAGLRCVRSGRPNSRKLASHHGIAFRPSRTKQVHGHPNTVIIICFHLCCCFWSMIQHHSGPPRRLRSQPRYISRASSISLCDTPWTVLLRVVSVRACMSS